MTTMMDRISKIDILFDKKYTAHILLYMYLHKDDEEGALCKSDVQRAIGQSKTVLNRINQLVDLGLIEQRHYREMYNMHYIYLTPKGRAVAESLIGCMTALNLKEEFE